MRSNVYLRKYETKKGEKRYYLVIREYGHKDEQLSLGPISKKLAEERRLQVHHELLSGAYRSEPEIHLYFSEMVEKFISDFAVGSRAPNTVQSYRDALKPLQSRFKGIKLNQIRRYDIEKFFASRQVSGRTKNICLSVLHLLFDKAVEWNYLSKSPVKGLKRFPEFSKGSRALTPSEFDNIWNGLTGWQRSLFRVMIYSGLRPGEVSALMFKDIDWERNRLVVANDRLRRTKNGKSRYIPMNQDLREELSFLKDNLPVQGRYKKNRHGGRDFLPREPHQSGYVFCNEDGTKVKSIRGAIKRALQKHGIEGVTPHGLRKTFCSLLARANTHPKVAQVLMGHSEISLTMEIYTDIDDQQMRDAVDLLPSTPSLRHENAAVQECGE